MSTVSDREIGDSAAVAALAGELKAINKAIWRSEEGLRACEQAGDFGPRFITLARSVYRDNDRRAALKRAIDERLESSLFEVKSYQN